MCELLVLREDRGNGYEAGDVVAVQRDGWLWSEAERGSNGHGFWTIIELPGVPEESFADMLDSAATLERVLAPRAKRFHPLPENPTLENLNAARQVKPFAGVIG